MKDWNIPGLAIVIVKDDKVVGDERLWRFVILKQKNLFDENTLFMMHNQQAFYRNFSCTLDYDKKLSLDDR